MKDHGTGKFHNYKNTKLATGMRRREDLLDPEWNTY